MQKAALDERFTQAIRAYRASMFALARSMLKNDCDAEDAVSAATLAAYRAAGRIRDWSRIKAYLLTVTANCCRGILRQRKRETVCDVAVMLDQLPAREQPLYVLLDGLPEEQRAVLHLFYYEDMPVADIARTLRLPRGTVTARLTRGRQRLRALLQAEREEALR